MKKVSKNILRVAFLSLLLIGVFGIVNAFFKEATFSITGVEVREKSDGTIVNDVSVKSGKIINDVTLSAKDDYIKYGITIKNDTKTDYSIKSLAIDNPLSYLEYVHSDLSGAKIEAGKEKTFELQIKYASQSDNTKFSDQATKLSLSCEKIDAIIYIVLSIIAMIGLMLTMTNKKHLPVALTAIVVVSVIMVQFGTKADNDKILVTLNNKIVTKGLEAAVANAIDAKDAVFEDIGVANCGEIIDDDDVEIKNEVEPEPEPVKHTLTIKDGEIVVGTIEVVDGEKVARPNDPEKEYHNFVGWYKEATFSTEFNFDEEITDDATMYAKFEVLHTDLISGKDFTTKMAQLSGYSVEFDEDIDEFTDLVADDYYVNDKIISIKRASSSDYQSVKDVLTSNNVVSTANSNTPTYLWFDEASGVMSYYTKAEKILLNKDASFMFTDLEALESLDLSAFDTSEVTNMSSMFFSCESLKSLDVSGFNTSKVTDMSYMFYRNKELKSLELNSFNTGNVINMTYMFYDIDGIEELNLSSFDTSSVMEIGRMFASADILRTIYVSSSFTFDAAPSDIYSRRMFASDSNLVGGAGTTFDADHLDIEYARIDDPASGKPGYFTDIADKP